MADVGGRIGWAGTGLMVSSVQAASLKYRCPSHIYIVRRKCPRYEAEE